MLDLWTDGSASPNPGAGGWAVIDGVTGEPVAIGGEPQTTNIRMEASALRAAMQYAKEKGERCVIHTDSEFWINVLTKWVKKWVASGWKKSKGKPVENLDLVKALHEIYNPEEVKLAWTRGHVGTKYNELADVWANKAREGARL